MPAALPSQPNIILILTDDQGWQDLGCFGHPYLKTPNLDKFARQGIALHQFYVNSPVCSPSRVAFMTGDYPARHRSHHIYRPERQRERMMREGVPPYLDPTVQTVTRTLREAGYRTGHFGKWHLGNVDDAPSPHEYGVDEYKIISAASKHESWPERNSEAHWRNRSTELIVDECIQFINRDMNAPFYLNLWTLLPHSVLDPSPEQLSAYAELSTDSEHFTGWMREYLANSPDLNSQMKVWCASITALDQAIGRLLDYLEKSGLQENTIILFASDNGPEDYRVRAAANAGVGSPCLGRARKRSLYEGGIRVPAIVRWPGHIAAGSIDKFSIISAVDWFPTICKWAGITSGLESRDGEAVEDILSGSPRCRRKPLFWEWRGNVIGNSEYNPPSLAMRSGPWKLLMNTDKSDMQLYNINKDPSELVNHAVSQPEKASEMARELLEWKASLPLG
jgi:N-acetylgalactosamine-6-sulfatase